MTMNRTEIIDWATEVFEDVGLESVRRYLAEEPGRKAAGMLPVYVPREVVHAAGMLPVALWGGGDRVEIIKGDAFYQSYICHLPRSVIELAQAGHFDMLSAMLFPSTCDVIRNLSGMWAMLYPSLYVRYLDVPQVLEPETGGKFWAHELSELGAGLAEISGVVPTPERLRAAIGLYNEARRLIGALYARRREAPWAVPSAELYVLLRAGEVVPVELYIERLRAYLAACETEAERPKDKARVIVVGAFCEQPPLGLIKTIERAGCYIVDDDFLLGNRFLEADVPQTGEPYAALAQTFISHAVACSLIFEPDPLGKRTLMKKRADAAGAQGVIFAAPSFCDPALLDQPMLRNGAEAAGLPCIAFRYAENTGQFQPFREQAGTFADSIKLWGEG